MRTFITTSASVALAALVGCSGAFASNGDDALYIDGKIRTEGVEMAGTTVLVERNGTVIQYLSKDIAHIQLRLELQRIYVLTFQRAGCLTKKLRFDTHVPSSDVERAPFRFPFKVTLKKADEEKALEYAQPVGFIRYFSGKSDFGYDTDFTLRRLEQEEADALTKDSPPLNVPRGLPLSLHSATPVESEAVPANGSPLPAIAETDHAPAQVAETPAPVLEAPKMASTAVTSPKVEPTPIAVPASVTVRIKPAATSTATASRATVRTPVRQAAPPAVPPVIWPEGRTEELLVEKTHVTTIVRITREGRTREYRRVVHRYGDVHYFQNGIICGEATYRSGILEQ